MLVGGSASHLPTHTKGQVQSFFGPHSKLYVTCSPFQSMAFLLSSNMDRGAMEYQLEAAISKIFSSVRIANISVTREDSESSLLVIEAVV